MHMAQSGPEASIRDTGRGIDCFVDSVAHVRIRPQDAHDTHETARVVEPDGVLRCDGGHGGRPWPDP